MKSFPFISPGERKIFFIPVSILAFIILVEVIIILILNSGLIVYTTDDAYIHLALAENILKGHYGVNLNEYSSPSSSILWPFILALFSGFSFGYLAPLIVNSLSAIGIIFIFFLVLKQVFLTDFPKDSRFKKIVLLFMILLIPASNLIGSIFIGMEHTLQIFFTVLIIWGLINAIQQKIISKWLMAAIFIAPLIRYENLALSFAALIFLYFTGYKKNGLLIFIFIGVAVAGFSIFLLNLELEPLPLSVYEKSKVISKGGSIFSLLENLKHNIISPRYTLLFLGIIFLSFILFNNKKSKDERLLSASVILAVLMQLIVGKPGRYVFYIWIALLLTLFFLYRNRLIKALTENSLFKITLLASIVTVILSYKYILGITTIPIGSNNIYEQQYQMHRFITEYYKQPVAVNDLGYVSYRNDYYVLDLVGLASKEALNHWRANDISDWIDPLSRKNNVNVVMIYDVWFYRIPASWQKVAELYLSKEKIAPAEDVVSVYILDDEIKNVVVQLLKDFRKTLPKGVRLILKEQDGFY